MLKINKLISIIEEIAPLSLAEPWDHCGIQVGTADVMAGREIRKVLTALEITNGVIDEALAYGVDLILVHHHMFDTYQTKLFDK